MYESIKLNKHRQLPCNTSVLITFCKSVKKTFYYKCNALLFHVNLHNLWGGRVLSKYVTVNNVEGRGCKMIVNEILVIFNLTLKFTLVKFLYFNLIQTID